MAIVNEFEIRQMMIHEEIRRANGPRACQTPSTQQLNLLHIGAAARILRSY